MTDLRVEKVVVGPLMVNSFIVWDEQEKTGIVIDPGEDADKIVGKIESLGIEIDAIVATHCHFDHIGGTAPLIQKIGGDFVIHEDDLFLVRESVDSGRKWGFHIEQPPDPTRFVNDGDSIMVGRFELKVIHTPGHSPGGISLYHEGIVFAGDALFQRSIGRTDFPKSSWEQLERSIKTKLYTLPVDTIVYTGHGPSTTIGEEKKHNMFVRA